MVISSGILQFLHPCMHAAQTFRPTALPIAPTFWALFSYYLLFSWHSFLSFSNGLAPVVWSSSECIGNRYMTRHLELEGNCFYDSALNRIQALIQNGYGVITQVHCIQSQFFPVGGFDGYTPAGGRHPAGGGCHPAGAVPTPRGQCPPPRWDGARACVG